MEPCAGSLWPASVKPGRRRWDEDKAEWCQIFTRAVAMEAKLLHSYLAHHSLVIILFTERIERRD